MVWNVFHCYMLSPLYRSTISFHFLKLKQVYWQDESSHRNKLYPQNAVQHIRSPVSHMCTNSSEVSLITLFSYNNVPRWQQQIASTRHGRQTICYVNVDFSRSVCNKTTVNLASHIIHSCPISMVSPCRFFLTNKKSNNFECLN